MIITYLLSMIGGSLIGGLCGANGWGYGILFITVFVWTLIVNIGHNLNFY